MSAWIAASIAYTASLGKQIPLPGLCALKAALAESSPQLIFTFSAYLPLQLAELKQKLEEVQCTASADHLAKVDLESRQHRLHDDTSRLEKRLAIVEADRESLSQQLKVNLLLALLSKPILLSGKGFSSCLIAHLLYLTGFWTCWSSEHAVSVALMLCTASCINVRLFRLYQV